MCTLDPCTRPTCFPLSHTIKPWGAHINPALSLDKVLSRGSSARAPKEQAHQSKELALTGHSVSSERTGHHRPLGRAKLTCFKTPSKNVLHSKYMQNIKHSTYLPHVFPGCMTVAQDGISEISNYLFLLMISTRLFICGKGNITCSIIFYSYLEHKD